MFDSLGHWFGTTQTDHRIVALFSVHYSAKKNGYKYSHWLKYGIAGPGETMTLLTPCGRAGWNWIKQVDRMDGIEGINCSFFHNESAILSSELVKEACILAWHRWPGSNLFTYVDPDEIASTNPGYCFKMAGWKQTGQSKKGLILLEFGPNS